MLDRMALADAEAVLRPVLDKAKAGHLGAAEIVLQRVWPPRKARVQFTLPELHCVADLPLALAAVVARIADGTLAPDEGQAIAAVLEQQRRAIELVDIDERLRALERRSGT